MHSIKIQKIGNSLGAAIPLEVLEKLNISEGDTVFLTETADGFQITIHDPDFQDAMAAFARTKKRYHNALHELAQ